MPTYWLKVATMQQVTPGNMLEVMAGGVPLCLYNLDGEICATAAKCTHGDASLADGVIVGDEVECPFHQGMFDIRTGRATASPCTEDLTCHAVKVEGDDILVRQDD